MEAISSSVQSLIDLFASDLADVRFGDIDAQTLGRLAVDVESAATVVASAEAALDGAREMLLVRQDALLQHAQRAIAYARVFAENDDALSARLSAIALPRLARRTRQSGDALVLSPDPEPSPRPRARPRKVHAAEPILESLLSTGE